MSNKVKLNIDNVGNLKNLGDRDLHVLGEDIFTLRRHTGTLYDKLGILQDRSFSADKLQAQKLQQHVEHTKSQLDELISLHASIERRIKSEETYSRELSDRLSPVEADLKAVSTQFKLFVRAFKGMEEEILDKDLKKAVVILKEKVRVLEQKRHNAWFRKLGRWFIKQYKDFVTLIKSN